MAVNFQLVIDYADADRSKHVSMIGPGWAQLPAPLAWAGGRGTDADS